MKKVGLLFLFAYFPIILPQSFDFNSSENIKKFADYLYCTDDYIRAISEYERYLFTKDKNFFPVDYDTIRYKISISQINIKKYDAASHNLEILFNSKLKDESILQYYKTNFLNNKFNFIINNYNLSDSNKNLNSLKYKNQLSIYYILSQLKLQNSLSLDDEKILENNINKVSNLNYNEKEKIKSLISFKVKPNYKNPIKAGVLSTLLPGSGKIYTKNYGDGITAFLLTSLFTFLSIDNFNSDHNFKGYLFGGIGLFFYSGNIYGSVTSTKIYNAKKDFKFNNQIDKLLEQKNYFISKEIEFKCEE
ncbi:MAG: hypothetical protein STSR0008_11560 [Ignavibacterium sp.]